MPFRGLGYPSQFAIKPLRNLVPSVRRGLRFLKDSRIGDNPKKRQQTVPRQSHRRIPVEFCIQPSTCAFVLLEGADVRIDQEVGVDENHLKDSPSATARTSATLSRFAARHEPRSTARVRKTLRFLAGALMHFIPSRRA